MRWKQFFSRVTSMDAPTARAFMDRLDTDEFNLIDVRQPSEYAAGHIPGAKLIPLGDLSDCAKDLDPGKPTLVY